MAHGTSCSLLEILTSIHGLCLSSRSITWLLSLLGDAKSFLPCPELPILYEIFLCFLVVYLVWPLLLQLLIPTMTYLSAIYCGLIGQYLSERQLRDINLDFGACFLWLVPAQDLDFTRKWRKSEVWSLCNIGLYPMGSQRFWKNKNGIYKDLWQPKQLCALWFV